MSINRNHQTAVFVRQGANEERVERFVDSLNRTGGEGTIKADIYTVTDDGSILSGLNLYEAYPSVSDGELREIGEQYGYALTVVVG